MAEIYVPLHTEKVDGPLTGDDTVSGPSCIATGDTRCNAPLADGPCIDEGVAQSRTSDTNDRVVGNPPVPGNTALVTSVQAAVLGDCDRRDSGPVQACPTLIEGHSRLADVPGDRHFGLDAASVHPGNPRGRQRPSRLSPRGRKDQNSPAIDDGEAVGAETGESNFDAETMALIEGLLNSPEAVTVPVQLRTRELRFITFPKGRKGGGNETGWNTTANYAWDDGRLVAHLANGGNYGTFPAEESGIAILDVDNYAGCRAAGLLDGIEGETFTVETGGSKPKQQRLHLFIRFNPPLTGKHELFAEDGKTKLADVYAQYPGPAKGYVVGANSLHKTGNRYRVVCDKPIKDVDSSPFAALLGKLTRMSSEHSKESRKSSKRRGREGSNRVSRSPSPLAGLMRSIAAAEGLRCSDFLMPLNPKYRGDEIEGAHPIHGSETGTNLTLSPDNTWYCRRCGSGGGPLEAYAVAEGHILCHEAHPGCLDGHWETISEGLAKWKHRFDSVSSSDKAKPGGPEQDVESAPALLPESKQMAAAPPRQASPEREENFKRQAALDRTCKGYNTTDSGNADRLVRRFGDKIRYCAPRQAWYVWDGRRWREDRRNTVMRLARQTAKRIYAEAAETEDDKRCEALVAWGHSSEFKERLKGMILLATADPAIAIEPDDLDANGNLLNLQNGTLELDTGLFREHRREDLLTKIAGVAYDKDATCPTWLRHLDRILGNDQDLITSMQELLGYAMLEGNPQQIFPIWHGDGQNGKSVTLSVIRAILGDYAVTAPSSLFLDLKDNGGPRPDVVQLRGARLVTAVETRRGQRLNEELVKQMTGGDPITARGLYKDYETWLPTHLAILVTNPLPRVSGDYSIMRRIMLWPFCVKIPDEERIADFEKVLLGEESGILNWLIEGLQRYYQNGRKMTFSATAKAATAQYGEEMDVLSLFLAEECVMDADGTVERGGLYALYFAWCHEAGIEPLPKWSFADAIKGKGIVPATKSHKNRRWKGVRIKEHEEHVRDEGADTSG